MSEWQECKLGEILKLITKGTTPPQGVGFVEKGINYIKSDAIDYNGKLDKSRFAQIDSSTHEKFKRSQLAEDDILYSMAGIYLGKNAIVPKDILPANTNQALAILRLNKVKALPRYVSYYLSQPQIIDFVNNMSGQSAQPNINFEEIKSIEITLPPVPEQSLIASVLSSLDDKIDLLYRQNTTLEAMAETLFRQWFLEEAMEEINEKPLEDILEFVVDNRGKTAPTSDSGIPLIATNCVKNSNIFPVYEKVRYVSQDTYDSWFRAHPQAGDLLFVNKGTPGCVNLVPDPVDFCIAQDMIALRVNTKLVSNYFLFLYFRLESTQIDILNTSVGTTIPHLKKTDLLRFLIPIPSKDLMCDFNDTVEPFFEKMNKNTFQIRTLTALRNTLLPKLMSGEVRVEN